MKRTFFIPILFILFSACSSSPSLSLTDANVDIVQDKNLLGSIEITTGEQKGKALIPTALYYECTLQNTGKQTVGSKKDPDKGIKMHIVPKESLQSVSEEVIGFNIFNLEEYEASGVGYGEEWEAVLTPDQEGKYTLHYDLGVSEENPDVPLLVPSQEELDELKAHALEAYIVISLDGEEITRFDLEKFQH